MAQWHAKDKTFLITGGASGLGAEYAQAFLEHGAKNVAILDIAAELGKATAEHLNEAHGNKVVFIKCDVSKEEDIASAFDSVLEQFKQIDVLINNAGVMVDAPDTWRTASDINWMDPFYEDTGIRVLTMCLGATDTPLVQNLETKAWDLKFGNKMAAAVENGYIYQKRESAVAALLEMFTIGAQASIWMSVDNKPVTNITASIDRAFKDFENVIAGLS